MSPDSAICRWTIRLAGLLVPAALRSEWANEWLAEVWHGYARLSRVGASPAQIRNKLLRFSLGAFADAADLRRSEFNLPAAMATPSFCLLVLLAAAGAVLSCTDALHNCRSSLQGLPCPEPDRLILLSRSARVLGIEAPPTLADLVTWQRKGVQASFAGYVVEGRLLRVTPNFYDVLGAAPRPPFCFLGHAVDFVGPLQRSSGSIGILARMKRDAGPRQVEAELARISRPKGTILGAKLVAKRLREPLVCATAVFALMLLIGLARWPWSPRGVLFFVAKTALIEGTIAAAWAEFASSAPLPLTGGATLATAVALPGLLLIAALSALAWALNDQRRRCPVCCRLLSMPVRIGSRSSIVLDRPGIEVLCASGHGSMYIPEFVVDGAAPATWTEFHDY